MDNAQYIKFTIVVVLAIGIYGGIAAMTAYKRYKSSDRSPVKELAHMQFQCWIMVPVYTLLIGVVTILLSGHFVKLGFPLQIVPLLVCLLIMAAGLYGWYYVWKTNEMRQYRLNRRSKKEEDN